MSRRRRLFPSKRMRNLHSRRFGILAIALFLTAAAGGLGWLFMRFAWPPLQGWINRYDVTPPVATPTPQPVGDMTANIRELPLNSEVLGTNYIIPPALLGSDLSNLQLIFASGMDNVRNPSLKNIVMFNGGATLPGGPENLLIPIANGDGTYQHEIQNDHILSLAANHDFIIYMDAKTSGGGNIYAYFREDYGYDESTGIVQISAQTVKLIKHVDYGLPELFITGEYAVWTERTGRSEDKLYACHIPTQQLTTLHIYQDDYHGLSTPGVSDSEIVWSIPHPDHPGSDRYSLLRVLPLPDDSGQAAEPYTYDPGMNIYKPVTNGQVRAWSDGNGSPQSNLFISVDGAMPMLLADNVSAYGMSKSYVVYCQLGWIWAYSWDSNKLYRLSPAVEYASLCSVSDYAVAWFDITADKRSTDLLKYLLLD